MKESVLKGKKILLVDDEQDILTMVEEEILESCGECKIDKASNYKDAVDLLKSNDYDLAILDIMGVRGFELLEIAVARKFKVAMLTAHSLSPEALKKSHDLGAGAYLPKDKLGELIPFLEDVLRYEHKTGWKRLMEKLDDYYTEKFAGVDWRFRWE